MIFLSKLQLVPLKACFLPSVVSQNAESEELERATTAAAAAGSRPVKLMALLKVSIGNKNVLGQKEKS